MIHSYCKVREGISEYSPRFHSPAAVFANYCAALESLTVGYTYVPTVNWKSCKGVNTRLCAELPYHPEMPSLTLRIKFKSCASQLENKEV